MKIRDEVGKRYSRLVVLGRAKPRPSGQCFWVCECVCGGTVEVRGHDLRSGHTMSCGCWKHERNVVSHTIHGANRTRLMGVYRGIKARVTNPKSSNWSRYGGRGITMFDGWLKSPAAFIRDVRAEIGDPPSGHLIDRIDNAGNYVPGNIRWATPRQSARNTRRCRYLVFNGETRCLSDWCQILRLPYDRTKRRLNLGWSVAAAFGRS